MIQSEQFAQQFIDMSKAIQRIREMHKETDGNISVCGDPDCCGEYEEGYIVCSHCYDDYPCMTIRALDGEQNENA